MSKKIDLRISLDFLFHCIECSKESSRVEDFGCLGVLGILGCEMELNMGMLRIFYTSIIINIE